MGPLLHLLVLRDCGVVCFIDENVLSSLVVFACGFVVLFPFWFSFFSF